MDYDHKSWISGSTVFCDSQEVHEMIKALDEAIKLHKYQSNPITLETNNCSITIDVSRISITMFDGSVKKARKENPKGKNCNFCNRPNDFADDGGWFEYDNGIACGDCIEKRGWKWGER